MSEGEGESRDVHFLNRPSRIAEPIERCLGDELEAGGLERFEERAQRQALATRQLLEIREREGRHRHGARSRDDFPDAFERRRHGGRRADDPQLARRRGARDGRARLRLDVRHADEGRGGAVTLASRLVGLHPDADDVGALGEHGARVYGGHADA